MSQIAVFFLLIMTQILAMLLALLGVETLPVNPLGWFLFLVGVCYTAGVGILYFIRRERFWEAVLEWATKYEIPNDRFLWFIILGLSAVFYLSPVEFLFLVPILPRNTWISYSGVGLLILGIALFIWARQTLLINSNTSPSVTAEQTLVQSGPYRFIRNPAYAGYLLVSLGVSLGYSSLAGVASIIVLLLPSLVYRMKLEEKMLSERFGAPYLQYMERTKRMIPGVW